MKPLVLCILDGVGMRKEKHGNSFLQTEKPNFDFLWNHYPHSFLKASGNAVGLPEGQMGNSEVGHMNIGAGRIVYQPLELINSKMKDQTFFENEKLKEMIHHAKENQSKLHLCGLLSDGGVHSHINHLFALLDLCKKENFDNVYLHLFLDGRDTLPDSFLTYYDELVKKMEKESIGKVASISGRYYAMDRDNRWDRVQKAYRVMAFGENKISDVVSYIRESYQQEIYDEFILPATVEEDGIIEDNDAVIVFNFRPDRLRELWKAFTNPDFSSFETKSITNLKVVTMMPVSEEVISKPAFHIPKLDHILGEEIARHGLKQLRIAETEKYAHVTYFFDGGEEKEYENCDRILIPSPKVATYDLKPEMSAYEITEKLLSVISSYDVIILNYANGDMVGHTGNMEATKKAVATLDECLGKLYAKVKELDGTLLVTADHGNCEYMLDDENHVITSHSTNEVPFILCREGYKVKDGKLGDLAPTILSLLSLEIPENMTGNNLLDN